MRIIVAASFFIFTSLVFAQDYAHNFDQNYEEIQQLLSAGAYQQALEEVQGLTKDVRLEFLEARALSGVGATGQAIAIYEGLVLKVPGYPEPYINLSALYAEQGELELAREWALKGLRVDKRYAKLYDNLVLIHGVLAARAYQLALDESSEVDIPELEISEELDLGEE